MANALHDNGPAFRPVPDRSLHHLVYAAIVDAIHRGEMRPGDLVTEAAIAGRLGISRSPVREAFSRLASEGLIVRLPRRGHYIAQLEREDIEHIQDARRLIEGYAARIAATRITPADAQALEEVIRQLVAAASQGEWVSAVSLNARFHALVVELSGNPIVARMWSSVDPLAWLVAATVPPNHRHDPADLARRHRQLLDALVSGDPDRAEQAFREHVGRSAMSWDAADSKMGGVVSGETAVGVRRGSQAKEA